MAEGAMYDREAIEALIARQSAAWNAGDAAAFSADVLPEVVFTNIVGAFSVGRKPFEAQHARIFATIYRGSRMRQTVEHVTFVRPDVAIVNTVTEVTVFSALPSSVSAEDGTLRTRLEQVLERSDGVWRVAAFHNVPVNPAFRDVAPGMR